MSDGQVLPPAGLEGESRRIHYAYINVFERFDRASEDERAYVLWRLMSLWCMGCGKALADCMDKNEPGCCCGQPMRDVTAKQCSKCETIHMDTVAPTPEQQNEER